MIDRVGMYSISSTTNDDKESSKPSPIREVLGNIVYESGGKKIHLVSKQDFDKAISELDTANKKIRSLTDEISRLTKYVNNLAKRLNSEEQRNDNDPRRFN